MSTAADEELRVLRARAYGPKADIESDPAALERLRHLEEQRQGRPSDVDAPLPDATAAPVMQAAAQPDPGAPAPGADSDAREHPFAALDLPMPEQTSSEGEPATRASSSRTSARMGRILWVAAIVAAAAAASAVTYALVAISPVPASSGAPQIDTLEASSILEIPSGWMGAGPSSATFDFFGLALVQTAGGYINGSTGTDCLTVVRADQVPDKGEYDSSSGWSSNGPVYAACGVGVFPATVEVPIDSDVPKELSERFPGGRALQFVFDGERVGVFLDSE